MYRLGRNFLKVFAFVFLLTFISCSGYDEVNSRLDRLEGEVRDIKTAITLLEEAYKNGKIVTSVDQYLNEDGTKIGWIITFSDTSSIRVLDGKDGDSLFQNIDIADGLVSFTLSNGVIFRFAMLDETPRLLSLEFLVKDNVEQLIDNVNCTIVGDSLVTCWIPYLMKDKRLVPHFSMNGKAVTIDNQEAISDVSRMDFSKPRSLRVINKDKETVYRVLVHAFTGLPVMWVETENRAPIVSKDEYLKAHMRLVEDIVTRAPGETIEADLEIKGRGNSTWGYEKKPYRLKFSKKISLLGESEDKSWVLLANYLDKSFLRNRLAFYLGSISNLDYTPSTHFVELMLNGRYNGTYELTEKIKVSENRVNVGKDGFLVEIDALASKEPDAVYFTTEHIDQPVNIKEPEVVVDDENYTYIKDFVCKAEKALYSDNFTDPENGWQKYLDMDSFVEWYLINEISRNNDAWRWSSTFLHLKRGGKLMMGPIWDFDRSFGNAEEFDNHNTEGFWLNDMGWYGRLFLDPVFVAKVKERFAFYFNHKVELLQLINTEAQYLHYSMIENNSKWNTLYNYISPNQNIWGNYSNEVQDLKIWINDRLEWLNASLARL